jgi:hypothetical protein
MGEKPFRVLIAEDLQSLSEHLQWLNSGQVFEQPLEASGPSGSIRPDQQRYSTNSEAERFEREEPE